MLRFGLSLGNFIGGKTPIIDGDFIWYSLDPNTGFFTSNGTRYINDEGNTVMVPPAAHPEPYGTKNGTIYGGNGIGLGSEFNNSSIDIPIDTSTDKQILYFTLTGKYYKLINLTTNIAIQEPVSQIVVLDVLATQDDLDYLNSGENVDALMDLWTERKTHSLSFNKSNFRAYYPCNDTQGGNLLWDTVSDSTIEIQNYVEECRTTYANINYGATDIHYTKDTNGHLNGKVPKNNHQISFTGDSNYVATGVVIDGSTNFSMMMAFTEHELATTGVIATTGGEDGVDNKIALRYEDDGSVTVIIGKTTLDATPHLDPNLPIHAFVCVYDATTKEVLGGADGADLQSFGTVDFDGVTLNEVRIGTNYTKMQPYKGRVGEGVLAAVLIDNDTWLQFWDRVRYAGALIQVVPCDRAGWTISESDAYSSTYAGWRAFNCTTSSGSDAWVSSTTGTFPKWIETSNDSDIKFVLTNFTMKGRTVVDNAHMTARAPNPLVVQGSNDGSTWTEIFRDESITSWNTGEVKNFRITDYQAFSKFRVVWENNISDDASAGGQMGWIKLYGFEAVTHQGEVVTNQGEIVWA